jgi:YihY family inner membrane protein
MDPTAPLAVVRRLLLFVGRVLRSFRRSQGLLLASAVAYNALLSLIPFFTLLLVLLSRVISQKTLLATIRQDLGFIVPGETPAVMDQINAFLDNRTVVGGVGLVALLFFSGMAFAVLENAMSVIFHHRVAVHRRHFLVSAVLPYLFVLSLVAAMFCLTTVNAALQAISGHRLHLAGWSVPLAGFGGAVLYVLDLLGLAVVTSMLYLVMPHGRMALGHALLGGVTATALWEIVRRLLVWYFANLSLVNVIYGSLATTVIVLLSFEAGAVILLLGAQVIAEVERGSGGQPAGPDATFTTD